VEDDKIRLTEKGDPFFFVITASEMDLFLLGNGQL
jgi:hypothetical protein